MDFKENYLKRGCTLIFKLFRNTFWVKISKTLKSLKNCFSLIKSDQDQIFRARIWPKGPDLGFGQISIGSCQNFSKVQKVDFFDPIGLKIGQNVVQGELFWLRRSNWQNFGIFGDFWSFLWFLTLFGNGQKFSGPHWF